MTTTELHDYLDEQIAKIIKRAVALAANLDPATRTGTIATFLMKTGMVLASKGGMPRDALEAGLATGLDELYGPESELRTAKRTLQWLPR